MRVQETFTIDAPLDRVMAVMRDPVLIEENERARDAVSVEVREHKRTDEEHAFDILTENYARGLTGPDRNRIERNQVAVSWNLKDATCRWRWTGGGDHARHTEITGFDALKPKGAATEVRFSVSIRIAVPIPFLGGQLSKIVAREFRKEWPRYVERVSRRAAARTG